eukprot:362868-Chlamydomonas_euryale.AAC.7
MATRKPAYMSAGARITVVPAAAPPAALCALSATSGVSARGRAPRFAAVRLSLAMSLAPSAALPSLPPPPPPPPVAMFTGNVSCE